MNKISQKPNSIYLLEVFSKPKITSFLLTKFLLKLICFIAQKVRDTGPWKCSLVTEENELAESTFEVAVFTPTEVDFGARPFRSTLVFVIQ